VARKVAKELGVDLSLVKGTGPEGRIKEEDVRPSPWLVELHRLPSVPPEPAAEPAEWLDLTPIQRLTGQRMLESIQTVPSLP